MDRIGASLRAFAVPLFLPTFGSQSESVLTDVNLWWSACSGQAATTELFDISGDADEKEQICPKLQCVSQHFQPCSATKRSWVRIMDLQLRTMPGTSSHRLLNSLLPNTHPSN